MSHGNPRHLKRNRRKEKRPQPMKVAAKALTVGLIGELAQPLHRIAWSQAIAEVQTTKT